MENTISSVAIVPLRAGSKGLAGKNTKLFAGKPLFIHAVEQGLRCCDYCVVTTDIDEIIKGTFKIDAEVYQRPSHLAGDEVLMNEVISDVIGTLNLHNKLIVLLQATSPLRTDTDVKEAIELYENSDASLVLGVSITDKSILKSGLVIDKKFVPINDANYTFMNRQMLPPVFQPNGSVFVFEANKFMKKQNFPNEVMLPVIIPDERALDIDNEIDFKYAEEKFITQISDDN